jgi:hypothetical protein
MVFTLLGARKNPMVALRDARSIQRQASASNPLFVHDIVSKNYTKPREHLLLRIDVPICSVGSQGLLPLRRLAPARLLF